MLMRMFVFPHLTGISGKWERTGSKVYWEFKPGGISSAVHQPSVTPAHIHLKMLPKKSLIYNSRIKTSGMEYLAFYLHLKNLITTSTGKVQTKVKVKERGVY